MYEVLSIPYSIDQGALTELCFTGLRCGLSIPGPIKQSSHDGGPYISERTGKIYYFLFFIDIPALMPTEVQNKETGNLTVELYDFLTFYLPLFTLEFFKQISHFIQLFSHNCLLTQSIKSVISTYELDVDLMAPGKQPCSATVFCVLINNILSHKSQSS